MIYQPLILNKNTAQFSQSSYSDLSLSQYKTPCPIPGTTFISSILHLQLIMNYLILLFIFLSSLLASYMYAFVQTIGTVLETEADYPLNTRVFSASSVLPNMLSAELLTYRALAS